MLDTIYHVFVSCLFYVIQSSLRLWFIIVDLKFPWRQTKKKCVIHKVFKLCCWGLHGSRMLRWYQEAVWKLSWIWKPIKHHDLHGSSHPSLWGRWLDPEILFWKASLHIFSFIFFPGYWCWTNHWKQNMRAGDISSLA